MARRFIYPQAAGVGAEGAGKAPFEERVVYFQDGFETGNLSLWTSVPWPADTVVNTTRPHNGTYSMEIHYNFTGPGDLNRYPSKTLATSHTNFFLRAYVYFSEASPPATLVGKKLFWVANSNDTNDGWQVLLSCLQKIG